RYEALDEVEKNTFVKATAKIEELRCELMQLVDKDTDAFNEVMKAFGLPKVNDAEKKIRQTAIEMATIKAIEVPMKAAEISHAILREICVILGYGNPNTLSDIGVAALLLGAGIEGSILNVKINLPGLIDREAAKSYATKADALLEKGKALSGQIVEKVHSRMNV
ncbi:MAG: cyclodeaminase/cyclohydrolase family protein, partial [Bacilli bacterium]|nr:cyclodeaminase/cyclohydrolase family protein [Bacilli bacterium]